MTDRPSARGKRVLLAIAATASLGALYLSAYFLLLDPLHAVGTPGTVLQYEYRVRGGVTQALLAPANWLDRRVIRRDHWRHLPMQSFRGE